MGAMQDNLRYMLKQYYDESPARKVTAELLLDSDYDHEIMRVYRDLGGIMESYPVNVGKYDLALKGLIIELDENLHFNRYRRITLNSIIYVDIRSFSATKYKEYCRLFEQRCLSAGRYGRKWTYESCEKQFGFAAKNGDLSGNGSPRWKQRAFYDYLKDVGCLLIGQKLVRLSIYDKINTENGIEQLGDILEHNRTQYAEDIYRYISKY